MPGSWSAARPTASAAAESGGEPVFILPGKPQPAAARPPPAKRPLLERPDLDAQFEYLLHVVWLCERWERTERHIDQLVDLA